jgi:hypothetical protein
VTSLEDHPVTDDTVIPERLRLAVHAAIEEEYGRCWHHGDYRACEDSAELVPVRALPAIIAATSSPEPGLDVERLARALFAVHPLMYPQSWPDDDPDDIGPDPTEDATAIAAEYARLASENRSA